MLSTIFTPGLVACTAVITIAVLFTYLIIAMDLAGARNPEPLTRLTEDDKAGAETQPHIVDDVEPEDVYILNTKDNPTA